MEIHYERKYRGRDRQLFTDNLMPLDFLTGPWNSIIEFEDYCRNNDIDIGNLPEGTNIRVVENNEVREYYRIGDKWKTSKTINISVNEDNEELIID